VHVDAPASTLRVLLSSPASRHAAALDSPPRPRWACGRRRANVRMSDMLVVWSGSVAVRTALQVWHRGLGGGGGGCHTRYWQAGLFHVVSVETTIVWVLREKWRCAPRIRGDAQAHRVFWLWLMRQSCPGRLERRRARLCGAWCGVRYDRSGDLAVSSRQTIKVLAILACITVPVLSMFVFVCLMRGGVKGWSGLCPVSTRRGARSCAAGREAAPAPRHGRLQAIADAACDALPRTCSSLSARSRCGAGAAVGDCRIGWIFAASCTIGCSLHPGAVDGAKGGAGAGHRRHGEAARSLARD
jgi:hypothetical protein